MRTVTITAILLSAGLTSGLASVAAHAQAAVTIDLPVTFVGLPVGKMTYTVRVEGDRYTIDGEGTTGGLGRLASSASSTFRSRGRLAEIGPVPRSHTLAYRDGKKEGSAAIKFSKGRVASVTETPPPSPRKDRVPVTPDMLSGAVDPTSAMIVPAAANASLASVCRRTIKVSDARNLFAMELSPDRSGRLADGTRTHTCRVRYRALGGHRASSKGVARFQKNESLRITFAPLGKGTALWSLVGFQMKTRFGRVRGTAAGVEVG